MTYLISTQPDGTQRWWQPGDKIPADHTNIYAASGEEAEIISQIIAQDAAGEMPSLDLGRRIRVLLAAAADYEESRKAVSGRPPWRMLNPADPYDMGMRKLAIGRAEAAIPK